MLIMKVANIDIIGKLADELEILMEMADIIDLSSYKKSMHS